MPIQKRSGALLFFIVTMLSACKTTEPKPRPKIIFLRNADRRDWKARIDSGNVGYYGQSDQKLLGLDTPPHTQGYRMIVPKLNMSIPCRNYLQKEGPQVTKLEFLVHANGKPSQFYVLKSAGPCDADAASGIKQATIIPAEKDRQNKAALVHMQIRFSYMQN